MIEFRNVDFGYTNELILKDINVSFKENVITGIIGLNGAGKTSLIKLLIDYLKPSKGEIIIDGVSIKNLPAYELPHYLAYVPQKMDLNYRFTVKEFVGLGLGKKNVAEALKITNLENYANRYILELSGGEQRLVYLARALACNSKYLILDEPTSSLDYRRELMFLQDLKKMAKSIVLTIHNPFLALKFCDEIVVIKDNTILGSYRTDSKELPKALEEVYGWNICEKLEKGNHYGNL